MKSFSRTEKTSKGFTLVEVLIVVAIIGILASVAISSYTRYVIRSHRGDAMEQLNEIMSQQQRFLLRQRRYTTDLADLGFDATTVLTDNGFYNIQASECAVGVGLNRCVLLTATPVADTSQEGDGTLTLTSRGQKTQNGQAGWYNRN